MTIRTAKILQAFRGQPPVDREALARIIVALGEIGVRNDERPGDRYQPDQDPARRHPRGGGRPGGDPGPPAAGK